MITRCTSLKPHRTAGLFAALLFAVFGLAGAVSAQSNPASVERITLTPVSKRLQLTAGQTVKNSLTVINDGDTVYSFKVYASPYFVKNEQYEPLYDTTAGQRDAARWVQFEKTSYQLQPGQRVEVPYSVLTPKTAAPGGYYAALFAETQAKNQATTGVGRNKRVGSLLLANVQGRLNRSGSLIGDATSFLQLSPPLNASLRLRNDGNVDYDAKITMQVYDIFGRLRYRSDNSFVVFPGTTRKTVVSWNQAPIVGIFKVKQTVQLPSKTEATSKYVLMMPSWMIITLIIVLVAGIASWIVKRKFFAGRRSER